MGVVGQLVGAVELLVRLVDAGSWRSASFDSVELELLEAADDVAAVGAAGGSAAGQLLVALAVLVVHAVGVHHSLPVEQELGLAVDLVLRLLGLEALEKAAAKSATGAVVTAGTAPG